MTEPTTTLTSTDSTIAPTSAPTGHPRDRFTVNREAQDPARGHLPLTVWLAAADTEAIPACTSGCCHPVSGPLARHLIAVCTRMGETVIHLGASDHQVVSAALTAGCLPVAVFTDPRRAGVTWTRLARTHPDYDLEVTDLRVVDLPDDQRPEEQAPPLLADLFQSAGLVVSEHSCDQPNLLDPCGEEKTQLYEIASAAGLVKPGGHLAVVTGLHRADRSADPLPEVIAQAREAGLVYLQHIIALRQPARGDRNQASLSESHQADGQEQLECAGLPTSARAHSDVLLFTRPRSLSEDDRPPVPRAGSPVDRGTTVAAGGGR